MKVVAVPEGVPDRVPQELTCFSLNKGEFAPKGTGYAMNKSEAWRYPNAANNAFDACAKLATSKWLHYIPPKDSDWIPLASNLQLTCK